MPVIDLGSLDHGSDPGDAPHPELVELSPSEFVETAFTIPDKKNNTNVPFSFSERRYLRDIYDSPSKKILLKCSRQSEKSTLLGNTSITYACVIRSFTILYVSPSHAQTKRFSQDRVKDPIDASGLLRAWRSGGTTDSVLHKKFVNRSQLIMGYAFLNADRTRGVSADKIVIDEMQDILTDNIPVIEMCASHSPFKLFTYAGTPKSHSNPIESFWSNQSTQNEWVVPCERHGLPGDPGSWHWNILGEDNIGSVGLVCDTCGKPIDAMHPAAEWASMNPSIRGKLANPFEGYRISQLMVPWLEWPSLLDTRNTYSKQKFYNEVLGLSFDSGARPLTREDIAKNCWTPGRDLEPEIDLSERALRGLTEGIRGGAHKVFAGIDWGGGGEHSHTVITLATYIGGFFTVFYAHRFEGKESEPLAQVEAIEKLLAGWGVSIAGVDWGGGQYPNDLLRRKFGSRIVAYQYSAPSRKVRWNSGLKHFLVHRTEVMSDVFNAIKRGDVFRFPRWDTFEDPFAKDMLNIYSEYNDQMRQVQYMHSPDAPDDTFHSLVLCFLASIIEVQRPDILDPESRTMFYEKDDDRAPG